MPMPKIEAPKDISLGNHQTARKLVKVVKLEKVDPEAAWRLKASGPSK